MDLRDEGKVNDINLWNVLEKCTKGRGTGGGIKPSLLGRAPGMPREEPRKSAEWVSVVVAVVAAHAPRARAVCGTATRGGTS